MLKAERIDALIALPEEVSFAMSQLGWQEPPRRLNAIFPLEGYLYLHEKHRELAGPLGAVIQKSITKSNTIFTNPSAITH